MISGVSRDAQHARTRLKYIQYGYVAKAALRIPINARTHTRSKRIGALGPGARLGRAVLSKSRERKLVRCYKSRVGIRRYHLGCAVWSFDKWLGELYRPGTPKRAFLSEYASVFNAVEGNSTFYAIPPPTTVESWLRDMPEGFRLCPKFPRAISHDQGLVEVGSLVTAFMQAIEPLEPHLGPIFLQLPPTFRAARLADLARFLEQLPSGFRYAVEVRHGSFFEPTSESRLVDLLQRQGVDRVVLDSRVLHRTVSDDGWIEESKRRKPRLPVRAQATGTCPFVRIIGNDRPDDATRCLAGWAEVTARWLSEGLTPYIFLHSPDDFHAPRLCRMFHAELSKLVDAGELPQWPAEDRTAEQLALL